MREHAQGQQQTDAPRKTGGRRLDAASSRRGGQESAPRNLIELQEHAGNSALGALVQPRGPAPASIARLAPRTSALATKPAARAAVPQITPSPAGMLQRHSS